MSHLVCLLFLVLQLAFTLSLHATQRFVPREFETIQEAADLSLPGDTVSVDPGVYHESVSLGPQTCLQGLGTEADQVVIDASGDLFAIDFSDSIVDEPGARITNLTLTGSRYWALDYRNGSGIVIDSCLITGNLGGAIRCAGVPFSTCRLSILQTTIAANGPSESLLDLSYVTSFTLMRSIIAGNPGAAVLYFRGGPGLLNIRDTNHFERPENSWPGAIAPFEGMLGNFSADPLFIDPFGDFHLAESSPCLPDHSPRGHQVGALGAAAGPPGFSACFWLDPYAPWIPSDVTFRCLASDQDLLYEWDLDNDGLFDTSGSQPFVTHTYTEAGYHSVTLRASDSLGRVMQSSLENCVLLGGRRLRVPEDFASIGEALAASFPGDSVFVACGTYFESGLTVMDGVYLGSVDGDPDCVTLDALGQGRILNALDSDSLTVRGITFRNGQTQGNGGAILFNGRIDLLDCRFFSNEAVHGGAVSGMIYMDGSRVIRCGFGQNVASGRGGAMHAVEGRFRECVFTGNTAGQAGGALCADASADYGYADDLGELADCRFEYNTAQIGGAILAGGLECTDCEFLANEASIRGGAISGSDLDMVDCRLSHNRTQGNGGAIDNQITFGPRSLYMHGCLLDGNHANGSGGGIHAQSHSYVWLYGCTLARNTASVGTAIWATELRSIFPDNPCFQLLHTITESSGPQHPFRITTDSYNLGPILVEESTMWAAEGFDWFDLESLEGQYCNQELDPLFCDPDEGDFNLLPTSPCRSYNHPCGVENGYSSGSCYPVAVPPGGLPVTLDLLAAPNPFNGRTVIHFQLPAAGEARLDLYDLLGRRVLELLQGPLSAGAYGVALEGGGLASGLYLLHLDTPSGSATQRILLLK